MWMNYVFLVSKSKENFLWPNLLTITEICGMHVSVSNAQSFIQRPKQQIDNYFHSNIMGWKNTKEKKKKFRINSKKAYLNQYFVRLRATERVGLRPTKNVRPRPTKKARPKSDQQSTRSMSTVGRARKTYHMSYLCKTDLYVIIPLQGWLTSDVTFMTTVSPHTSGSLSPHVSGQVDHDMTGHKSLTPYKQDLLGSMKGGPLLKYIT